MPDDARTRGIEAEAIERIVRALFDAGWVAPRTGSDDAPDAITTVRTALTGWAPPPATSSAAPEGAALPGTEEPVAAQDSNTRTRSLPPFRKVAGTCPACSGSTLMLGAGDHVTCSWIGCPDPMAARRLLDPPAVSGDHDKEANDGH